MKLNLFKKTESAPNNTEKVKVKNVIAATHGTYATAVIAIVLCVVVLLNVGFNVIGDRLNLAWDVTSQGTYTLGKSNEAFLKTIDKPVEIIFCASEEDYTGSYFAGYASTYYQTEDTTGKYFPQTIKIVKQYGDHNKNFNVRFIDPQTNKFNEIKSRFPDLSIGYGDILVTSTFKGADGKAVTKHKQIGFYDLYEQKDESGAAAYGYTPYTIASNDIETQLSSAIARVTSEKNTVVSIISTHSNVAYFENFVKMLELNSYEVRYVSDPIITEKSISKDTDMLIMGAVMNDFTVSELDVIDAFLDNDGNRGKGLVFYASAGSPKLTNLYEFFEEWGISVGDGILYETNDQLSYQSPTDMLLFNNNNTYTADMNTKKGIYLAGNIVPLEAAFERYDGRQTNILLYTSDTVINVPKDIDDSFKPDSSYAKSMYTPVILTVDTSYENDTNGLSSYVAAFGSMDFVESEWTNYTEVLNLEFDLCVANVASGRNTTDLTFTSKSINPESFAEKVTQRMVTTINVIFLYVIPISLLVICVVVYFRRKNR